MHKRGPGPLYTHELHQVSGKYGVPCPRKRSQGSFIIRRWTKVKMTGINATGKFPATRAVSEMGSQHVMHDASRQISDSRDPPSPITSSRPHLSCKHRQSHVAFAPACPVGDLALVFGGPRTWAWCSDRGCFGQWMTPAFKCIG